MENFKEYVVIARPFYREHPPMIKKRAGKDKEDAINNVMNDSDVKEILEITLADEFVWNEETKEKYWSLYR